MVSVPVMSAVRRSEGESLPFVTLQGEEWPPSCLSKVEVSPGKNAPPIVVRK